MLVSVIIPTLNEAASIAGVLDNVAGMPGEKEIIVADGASTDGTVEIARAHATLVSGPRGRGVQMNAGAAVAHGGALLFLHADTILPPDALNAVERTLSDPAVVGGRFKVKLDNTGWRYRMVGWSINVRDCVFGGFTGDQAIFVRRDIFNKIGGYPPVGLMEDLEFGCRLCRQGKVARLPLYVTTSARRWENGGVLRTVFLMWTLRLLYFMRCPPSLLQRWYNDAR